MQLKASVILLALLGQPWHEAKQALRDLERTQTMATEHRWQGATGNWQLAGNWDTGEIPSVHDGTDSATFGTLSQLSVTAGLDLSAEFPLKRIITEPLYAGDIGSSASPLIANLETLSDVESRIIHRGSGEFHFRGTVGDPGDVVVDSQFGSFFADGFVRNIFVKRGFGRVLPGCSLGVYAICIGPSAHLIIDADPSSDPPAFLIVSGGVVENARAMRSTSVIVVTAGRLIQTGVLPDDARVFIGENGRFDYTPNVTLTASHDGAKIVNLGMMDFSLGSQVVDLADHITGPDAGQRGSTVQSGAVSALSTKIDLREEYP